MAFLSGMRFLIPTLFCLVACTPAFSPSDEEAIRAVMHEQESAWNEGDIPGFMAGYWEDVVFISPKGLTHGSDGVQANYERSYPDGSAMGRLTFGVHEVTAAGGRHAWVSGTWSLLRSADTLSGGFSLLWEQRAGSWRIVRDHSY